MKNLNYLIMIIIFSLGCAKREESKVNNNIDTTQRNQTPQESQMQSFKYEFEQNGCNTGKKEFSSKSEMCQGLQQESLNNGCALELRKDYFKQMCDNQNFASSEVGGESSQSYDVIVGERLVRTLKEGDSTLVLYLNPLNESAKTMVFCGKDSSSAKEFLKDFNMGGIFLSKGARIVLKNDVNNTFRDGTNLKGKFIQIKCL